MQGNDAYSRVHACGRVAVGSHTIPPPTCFVVHHERLEHVVNVEDGAVGEEVRRRKRRHTCKLMHMHVSMRMCATSCVNCHTTHIRHDREQTNITWYLTRRFHAVPRPAAARLAHACHPCKLNNACPLRPATIDAAGAVTRAAAAGKEMLLHYPHFLRVPLTSPSCSACSGMGSRRASTLRDSCKCNRKDHSGGRRVGARPSSTATVKVAAWRPRSRPL